MLLNKLEKYLDWEDLRLIRRVLDTTNASYINDEIKGLGMDTFYQKGAGLPIGNYTSQFLAIFYLNDLDHYIKSKHIDIITLTSYKRNIFSRLFNPSIARKMIFHSDTPLMVVYSKPN